MRVEEKRLDRADATLVVQRALNPTEMKTDKVAHRVLTKMMVVNPVTALTPSLMKMGGGALGYAVAGVPGTVIGRFVGEQIGVAIADKVGDYAGQAVDRGIDGMEVAVDGVKYVVKKVVEGVIYVVEKVRERVLGHALRA